MTITLRSDLALASVMARVGKTVELSRHATKKFGIELPYRPQRVYKDTVSFIWAGPGLWLAAKENGTAGAFEHDLRDAFAGLASVTNQSDGRTVIQVSGPKVRQMLAKGVPIDLDPREFRPGDTALTVAAHINVHFWLIDDTPIFEFAVFRSFAAAFVEQLSAASAEFGFVIDLKSV